MRLACALVAVMAAAALSSCTQRRNSSQCVTGDQKGCPCLGGGDGVQVCQSDGTYAACQCLPLDLSAPAVDDMIASSSGSYDIAVSVPSVDMAHVVDLSSPIDASPPAGDMTLCLGGTPDEDADGRANWCDLCPADPDPTPVDTDSDGLPDACDPDPSTATNAQLYFEPFDSADPHWSGGNPQQQSFVTLDPGMVA